MPNTLGQNLQATVTRYTLARLQRIQVLIPIGILASTLARRLPGILTLSIGLAVMLAFWLVLRSVVTRMGVQTVRVDADAIWIGNLVSIPRSTVQRWTFSNGVASILCAGTSYRLRTNRNSEAGVEDCLHALLGAPTMLQKRGSPRARLIAGTVMIGGLAATISAFVLDSLPPAILACQPCSSDLQSSPRYRLSASLVDQAHYCTGCPASIKLITQLIDPLPLPVNFAVPVHITLPDGNAVRSDETRVHDVLSALLGRAVRLASHAPQGATFDEHWPDIEGVSPEGHRDAFTSEPVGRMAPPGTFFDMTAFHVMSRRSLAALADATPTSRITSARFRPTIEIEHDAAPAFIENAWVGKLLQVGDKLALKVLIPTMRCVMVTLAQQDLPSDPQVLRALVAANRVQVTDIGKFPCIGAYASLARKLSQGGIVRRGDVCSIS